MEAPESCWMALIVSPLVPMIAGMAAESMAMSVPVNATKNNRTPKFNFEAKIKHKFREHFSNGHELHPKN